MRTEEQKATTKQLADFIRSEELGFGFGYDRCFWGQLLKIRGPANRDAAESMLGLTNEQGNLLFMDVYYPDVPTGLSGEYHPENTPWGGSHKNDPYLTNEEAARVLEFFNEHDRIPTYAEIKE